MKPLFKAETIAQFKIDQWLRDQDLTADDVARVERLGNESVKLTNPAGQWMVITCHDGKVEIDQRLERESQKPERHSIQDKPTSAKERGCSLSEKLEIAKSLSKELQEHTPNQHQNEMER